jgi:hypothetical protein
VCRRYDTRKREQQNHQFDGAPAPHGYSSLLLP